MLWARRAASACDRRCGGTAVATAAISTSKLAAKSRERRVFGTLLSKIGPRQGQDCPPYAEFWGLHVASARGCNAARPQFFVCPRPPTSPQTDARGGQRLGRCRQCGLVRKRGTA